jgi:anti-sigma regulatory factor (Ser/Thr protein kinase)
MAREFQTEIAPMAHIQSLSFLPRNAHSVPFVEVRQSLPSKAAAISPFADQLMRFSLKFRTADGSEIDIEMALHEALANAVVHGNGGNSYKRVYVACRCYMDGEVSITVRDEGQGFDCTAIPDPTFSREPAVHAWSWDLPPKDVNGRSLFRRRRRGCHDAKEI